MPSFTPAATATLTAGTTSTNAAVGVNLNRIRIVNASGLTIFWKTGNSTVTATTSDTPMLTGWAEVFSKSPTDTHFAVIVASGSGAVYVTAGEGD